MILPYIKNTHIIGLPQIGENRELKFAIEKYMRFKSIKNLNIIKDTREKIIKKNIILQKNLDITTIGFHTYYDSIIYTMMLLNIIPLRFINILKNNFIENLIIFTKGKINAKPLKMKKWFNTNLHYFIPEVDNNIKSNLKINELRNECKCTHKKIKLTIVGIFTFINLSKFKKANKRQLIKYTVKKYIKLIKNITEFKKIKILQIEEPYLSDKINNFEKNIIQKIYKIITKINSRILLTTYFNNISKLKNLKKMIPSKGIHVDIIKNKKVNKLLNVISKYKIKSIGVVDTTAIWVSDILKKIKSLKNIKYNIWISSNSSAIHIPYNNENENFKQKELTSFAKQKISEIIKIKNIVNQYKEIKKNKNIIERTIKIKNKIINSNKKTNKIIKKNKIKKRNYIPYKKIKIEELPITTIGSFPQTKNIRVIRKKYKNKNITKKEYENKIKNTINAVVNIQKKNKIDLITNGEIERNDMVEYFCENIKGCIITKNGWVQSYGTRCVKPAIIIKKLKISKPITYKWNKIISKHNCKFILTGPLTMTKWSFVINCIKKFDAIIMFSKIIKKEINKLTKLNPKAIQIDEPAIIEYLSDNTKKSKEKIKKFIKIFNYTCCKLKTKKIQIHTHICYSEMNKHNISIFKKMSIDVLSIEASKIIKKTIKQISKSNITKNMEIGIGIYDVHSDVIPSRHDLIKKIKLIINKININKIWINPDCGLKTRTQKEVSKFLKRIKYAKNKI